MRLCHALPKESVMVMSVWQLMASASELLCSQDFCLRGLFGHPDKIWDGRCSDVHNWWPEWQDLESATHHFPIGKSSRWEISRASHAGRNCSIWNSDELRPNRLDITLGFWGSSQVLAAPPEKHQRLLETAKRLPEILMANGKSLRCLPWCRICMES